MKVKLVLSMIIQLYITKAILADEVMVMVVVITMIVNTTIVTCNKVVVEEEVEEASNAKVDQVTTGDNMMIVMITIIP